MQELSSDNLRDLKDQYVALFQQWCRVVPQELIASANGSPRNTRSELLGFLELQWLKMEQDLNGALVLLHSNHLGPGAVMARVIRENAFKMLGCAFDEPENDASNLHYLVDHSGKKDAKRLIEDCEQLKSVLGLRPDTIAIIDATQQWATSVQQQDDEYKSDHESKLKQKKRFTKLAVHNASLLAAHGLGPDLLVRQIINYWEECEAVHNGPLAWKMYGATSITGDPPIDAELSVLRGVRSLLPATIIVTAALRKAGGLEQPRERHKVAARLTRIDEIARDVLYEAQAVKDGNAHH